MAVVMVEKKERARPWKREQSIFCPNIVSR